jgi:hypothetical protein
MQSILDELLFDGRLHSPFFIFIRQPHGYSDFDILANFQLGSYRRSTATSRLGRHAILSAAGNWTMVADDWRYTLWHMPSTRTVLEAIAKSHEVFTCSVGDCDLSFDYAHYQVGNLKRKYVVSSPHFTDRVVVEDFGAPSSDEVQLPQQAGDNPGIELAERMGIQTRFTSDSLRIYVPGCDA